MEKYGHSKSDDNNNNGCYFSFSSTYLPRSEVRLG